MSTAPFDPSVTQLIAQSHEQGVRAEIVTSTGVVSLDATDWDLDWDETRAPRVQGSVTVPIPDTQDVLDTIDPRTTVRVRLFAFYRLPSGVIDEQQVADLGLRTRRISRSGDGGGAMTLGLSSDEALVIDGGLPSPANGDATSTFTNLTAVADWVVTELLYGGPAADPEFVSTMPDTGSVVLPQSPHPWDALADLLDQYDANLFDDGDRVFRLEPRRQLAAASVLRLTHGANGTIVASNTTTTRDDWANWVTVAYRWSDATGAENWTSGYATITGGPFRPSVAGYKYLVDVRDMVGTPAAGNRAAATLLRRLLGRSRSFTISAVPAWWVRPGRTVTIQLPLGAQERHLVSRVAFRPDAMTIETRLPDNASTIGE